MNNRQSIPTRDVRFLRDLVKQGEGDRLEFKLKSNHPDKIVREMIAFANSGGGNLLLGVSDDRTIQGVKYPDEDDYTLAKAISSYCYPPIDYRVERISVGSEREVLIYSIAKSAEKPHYFVEKETGKRKAFVRIADRSVQASPEMCEIMRRSRKERDVRFRYGEKEKILMHILEEQKNVTVDMYAEAAGISRKQASQTLVLLVLANVLEIHPNEVADYYTVALF